MRMSSGRYRQRGTESVVCWARRQLLPIVLKVILHCQNYSDRNPAKFDSNYRFSQLGPLKMRTHLKGDINQLVMIPVAIFSGAQRLEETSTGEYLDLGKTTPGSQNGPHGRAEGKHKKDTTVQERGLCSILSACQ